MTKKGAFLVIFIFVALIAKAQDFNVPFSLPGVSNHPQLKRLSDSTFISLTSVDYLSKVTNQYDSGEWLMVRYNLRGEMMYYTKVVLPPGLSLSAMDIAVSGDRIFLGGYSIDNITEEFTAFLMRFNECLEVEKYKCLKYVDESNAYFNELFSFSDTSILVTGNYFIPSDTLFLTVFSMNHDFEIQWQTTVMGDRSDIVCDGKNFYLWGAGYYPTSYKPDLVEIKLNHITLNLEGKVQSQFVQDEHTDGAISQGWRIVKPLNSKFLIANEGRKPSGKLFHGLRKMGIDGTLIKSVQLNDNKNEESCGGLCRINDNRYMAIGVWDIDNYNTVCMAYLVDSNLNVIRKKRILPNLKLVGLSQRDGPIPFNNGALLYGRVFDSIPGTLPKGLIYKIDTFLNVVQKPTLVGYKDSLCLTPVSGQICVLPKADTIWLEKLKLRNTIKLVIDKPISSKHNVTVFPNPSNGDFKIGFDKQESGSVFIYNNIGQLIFRKEFKNEAKVDLHILDIISSFYYVEIRTAEYTVMKKVTVIKQ